MNANEQALRAQIAALIADNEAVKAAKAVTDARLAEAEKAKRGGGVLTAKISKKGAISLYGAQRMPITLYAEQWQRLFAEAKPFIDAVAALPEAEKARLQAIALQKSIDNPYVPKAK